MRQASIGRTVEQRPLELDLEAFGRKYTTQQAEHQQARKDWKQVQGHPASQQTLMQERPELAYTYFSAPKCPKTAPAKKEC